MDPKRTLTIELTPEHARLYLESATFKQGVDAFLRGVVPLYLNGLAAKAVATDIDIESRMKAILRNE